jgi:hypothetical protein
MHFFFITVRQEQTCFCTNEPSRSSPEIAGWLLMNPLQGAAVPGSEMIHLTVCITRYL